AGVALLGQLGNFTGIVQTLASGGICNGITKYVAQNKDNESVTRSYLSAALKITLVCSVLCGLLMIAAHRWLSELIMLTPDYGYVFVVFGFTAVLYALNAGVLAALNGFKQFRTFVVVSIVNSIVGVLFTVSLVLLFGLRGALISYVTYQSVVFAVTVWMLRRSLWMRWSLLSVRFDRSYLRRYGGYAMMAVVTTLMVPLVQMLLRGYVMADISGTQAGIWEGMQKISSMYLMVVTTSLSVYYLPRLSEIKDATELRSEIGNAFRLVIPLLVVAFLIIYLSRYFIISILFTADFTSMAHLFAWQMGGDLIRIASWLLAFVMVAKAMTVHYVVSEVLSALCYLALGYIFVSFNGIVGLVQANLLNYILYLCAMAMIFRRLLFAPEKYKLDG
ncbi:MAG: O-antigen translocase, partial [Muribaculaceae bacterium]|nr:O-antigen translocase [Muribaculaceae bacterium]